MSCAESDKLKSKLPHPHILSSKLIKKNSPLIFFNLNLNENENEKQRRTGFSTASEQKPKIGVGSLGPVGFRPELFGEVLKRMFRNKVIWMIYLQ